MEPVKKKLYVVMEERIDWKEKVKEELYHREMVSVITTNSLEFLQELIKQLKSRDDFDVTFVRFDRTQIMKMDLEDMECAFEMNLEMRPVRGE